MPEINMQRLKDALEGRFEVEKGDIRQLIKPIHWEPTIPNETRLRFLKIKSSRRETWN